MKKRILLTALLVSASLVACHRQVDRVDHIGDGARAPHHATRHYNQRNYSGVRSPGRHEGRTGMHRDGDLRVDTHHDYVTGLGFRNVVNPHGDTYHNRYRLDATHAARPEIFEGWRHAWHEPHEFMDKDIDVYRYTGEYNGENRVIYVKSHNGRVIGGYHHGEGEDITHARILHEGNHTSRVADDFRNAWDDLFGIRR